MKYTTRFATEAAYEEAKSSIGYPNVSLIDQTDRLVVERTEPVPPPPAIDYLCFTALENATVTLNKNRTPADIQIEYSSDSSNWQNYSFGTVLNINAGDKVYFRNQSEETTSFSLSSSSNYQFSTSGDLNLSGNLMTLVRKDGNVDAVPCDYCFHSLFLNCSIVDANELELPASTLTARCYYGMFSGCEGLTAAPALPATTLADYCYCRMFLKAAITAAPELPASTLTANCYDRMFNNCPMLAYVKCLATNCHASNCTATWITNDITTGTFVKKAGVEWPTGTSGIPEGWTVIEV